ncbi:Meiotic nuclear division protein 1, partial [Spiromyces aspiralis]
SKTKRVSQEEKLKRMLDLLHESKDFFQLKELEKLAPKQKGIVAQSVKDVLASLVNDNLVRLEKIGTSNYYWSFPSDNAVKRQTKLEQLQKELKQQQTRNEELKIALTKATEGKEESGERDSLLEELKVLEEQLNKDTAELEKFRECDPEILRQKEAEALSAKDAANRWTENIFMLQSWVSTQFNVPVSEFNKNFGIPNDLDTAE